ncbi:hypothetical protein NA56DRAFT_585108, partial [Hyaloscypha hepaticicola]
FRSRFRDRPALNLDPIDIQYEFCGTLHWRAETIGGTNIEFELYYKRGDVILELLQPPPDILRALLVGQYPQARSFRQNIRAYNSALAFISVSYTKDTHTDLSRGLYYFQIHRKLFHYQGPLIPGSQDIPAFTQLFFYDPEYTTNIRYQLDRSILRNLHNILTDHNPFIRVYKTARERLANQPGDFRLFLNPQIHLVLQSGTNRYRENLPILTELAGILPDKFTGKNRRDVLLTVREPGHNSQ